VFSKSIRKAGYLVIQGTETEDEFKAKFRELWDDPQFDAELVLKIMHNEQGTPLKLVEESFHQADAISSEDMNALEPSVVPSTMVHMLLGKNDNSLNCFLSWHT